MGKPELRAILLPMSDQFVGLYLLGRQSRFNIVGRQVYVHNITKLDGHNIGKQTLPILPALL